MRRPRPAQGAFRQGLLRRRGLPGRVAPALCALSPAALTLALLLGALSPAGAAPQPEAGPGLWVLNDQTRWEPLPGWADRPLRPSDRRLQPRDLTVWQDRLWFRDARTGLWSFRPGEAPRLESAPAEAARRGLQELWASEGRLWVRLGSAEASAAPLYLAFKDPEGTWTGLPLETALRRPEAQLVHLRRSGGAWLLGWEVSPSGDPSRPGEPTRPAEGFWTRLRLSDGQEEPAAAPDNPPPAAAPDPQREPAAASALAEGLSLDPPVLWAGRTWRLWRSVRDGRALATGLLVEP